VVAGTKVGKAVRRNKVKRRLREIVRHECEPGEQPVDLIVTALPAAGKAGFRELRDAAVELFRRARLLPPEGAQEADGRRREG
jgi:ribonuclease P protein component